MVSRQKKQILVLAWNKGKTTTLVHQVSLAPENNRKRAKFPLWFKYRPKTFSCNFDHLNRLDIPFIKLLHSTERSEWGKDGGKLTEKRCFGLFCRHKPSKCSQKRQIMN